MWRIWGRQRVALMLINARFESTFVSDRRLLAETDIELNVRMSMVGIDEKKGPCDYHFGAPIITVPLLEPSRMLQRSECIDSARDRTC